MAVIHVVFETFVQRGPNFHQMGMGGHPSTPLAGSATASVLNNC